MNFLQVNVTFYDAVNMIHDIIRTANTFQYTEVSNLEIITLNKLDIERYIEYVHRVVVYQRYLTQLGEMIIFEPRLKNYPFSQLTWILLIYHTTICTYSLFIILQALTKGIHSGWRGSRMKRKCRLIFICKG